MSLDVRLAGALLMLATQSNPVHASDTSLSYLALGDSYTIGEGVSEAERWPVVLARQLRTDGVPLDDPRIIATTGWTTADLSAAMDEAEPLGRWDFVSLLIGVNNQYQGRSVDEYEREFANLLERAIGLAGGRADRVIVLAIPDWGVTPFAANRDGAEIAAELDEYNARQRAECVRRDVTYVDIAPVSRRLGADPANLAADGLHPGPTLYQHWADQAVTHARRQLESR